MQQIYIDHLSKQKKKKRGNVWSVVLLFAVDVCVGIISILTCIGLFVSLITQHIEPETMGRLSTIVLAAPLLFGGAIIEMFYWLIRWKLSMVGIVACFIFISLFSIDKYYGLQFKKSGSIQYRERNYVKVLSYNVANGDDDALVDSVATIKADIICLQEFLSDSSPRWQQLKNYNTTFNGENSFSNEIFTRHRILKQGKIDSLPRYNAIWADVLIKYDTIRVVNLHLQSTTLREQDTQFIQSHEYLLDTARTTKFAEIVNRLQENNIKRRKQVATVMKFLEECPKHRPTIVCGDFNDVPLSYTLSEFDNNYRNCFEEAGVGYIYTFKGFFRLLCIDYIYVSEGFDVVTCDVLREFDHSDHFPIVSRLKLKK